MGGVRALFRADASPDIGGGHVMRCLTLADELRGNGWASTFAVSAQTVGTVPALGTSGHCVEVLPDTGLLQAEALQNTARDDLDLLVIDHYGIGEEYERKCREFTRKILVIDDLANRSHCCDVLLDQTLGRKAGEYAALVPRGCQILVGSEYALLRPQFAHWRALSLARREKHTALRRILVSMGMTDPMNISERVLEGIEASGLQVEVDVLLGGGAPHLERIRNRARTSGIPVTVHASATDVAPLLAEADLAIGAAGSSSWERCCLGVPSVVLVVAENQRRVANELAGRGAVMALGGSLRDAAQNIAELLKTLASSFGRIYDLSQNAAAVCDGRGTRRFGLVLEPVRTKDGCDVTLRYATEDDVDQVLSWQSCPDTRRYARNPIVPTTEEHYEWFHRKLAERENYAAIIECDGNSVGMLRLDRVKVSDSKRPAYEVSILVSHDNKNKGIGYAALMYARRLFPEYCMCASIHPENQASLNMFIKAGYVKSGENYVSLPTCEMAI